MDIDTVSEDRSFNLNANDLASCTIYECDNKAIVGPILIHHVGNVSPNIVIAVLLGPNYNGMSYVLSKDNGLKNAKYRKFKGSVTLTER